MLNVATAAAIADAIIDGRPLIDRITTVTGHVKHPGNLRLRIGTMLEDVIGACDGYDGEPAKIIMGGAMTGFCAPDHTISIVKGTGGVVVLNPREAELLEESPCIRCARCVNACPVGLNPYLIRRYCDAGDLKGAQNANIMDCILCGCCSYACPARRYLTQTFKINKERIAQANIAGPSCKRERLCALHNARCDHSAVSRNRVWGIPVWIKGCCFDLFIHFERCFSRIRLAEALKARGASGGPFGGCYRAYICAQSASSGAVVDSRAWQRVCYSNR